MYLLERTRAEDPAVQGNPAYTEGVLDVLVRTGAVPINRD
jgi:hypothetical protein